MPVSNPIFAEHFRNADLHTHAPINHLIYHLGPKAMVPLSAGSLTLTDSAARSWHTFTRPGAVREELEKLPKLKIPGGKMERK
jgi:hypothetical protein